MTWCCLFLAYFLRFEAARFKSRIIFDPWIGPNRPFAANHLRGTKPPCWRAKVALGQDEQRKLPFKIFSVFCLSCNSATFALHRGGFVPREWLAAKGLFSPWMIRRKSFWRVTKKKKKARNLTNWPCFITCITNIFLVHRIHVYSTRKSDQTGLSF